jgi:RND family efflux transporter MFP subunit
VYGITKDSGPLEMAEMAWKTARKSAIAERDTVLQPSMPRLSERSQMPLPSPHHPLSQYQLIAPISTESLPDHSFAAVNVPARSRGRKKRGTSILVILIIVGTLLALLVGSLWLSSRANADVTLVQVETQRTAQVIGGSGTLYPRQQLNITYPVAERVLSVLVHAGDQITADQALLHLDTTQLDAQLKLAANNVAAAQDYLATVSRSGNAVTIAQAQRQLALAKNDYATLATQSAYPFIRSGNLISPMSGMVTAVNINAGEILAPNAVLLVIMDESALVVHMQVPLENVGQVHVGTPVQITPSASANRTFSGTVSAVIPRANPQTNTFEVWINVNDSQHVLLPGMNVFVRILLPTTAIVVPRLSVMTMAALTAVFVVREQHAYLRLVQVVGRQEDRLLIASGLKQGEYIVLVGLDQLSDGQSVSVRTVEHPGGTL